MRNPKLTEEQKLIAWFNSDEGKKMGEVGDYNNWSCAETAIHYMKRLIAIKKGLISVAKEI